MEKISQLNSHMHLLPDCNFCVHVTFTDGSKSQKFPTISVGILALAITTFLLL